MNLAEVMYYLRLEIIGYKVADKKECLNDFFYGQIWIQTGKYVFTSILVEKGEFLHFKLMIWNNMDICNGNN